MEAIEPEERSRLIEEAMKGRDNVIRYNLQSTNDWQFQQEIDGLKYFTRPTTSPHEIHGQISGVIFQPPLFVLHHFAVWKYRSKYERDYLQMSKIPLDETSHHQIHLVHGVYRPVLFLIKRDHVGVEYIGKIQYEGSEYHVASCRNVQTPLIPLYNDYDRADISTGLTIEPRNEGRYSFVKFTVIMKLDRVSPNFCGKVQGMLKSAVMCKTVSCIPTFKQAWENEDEDDPMVYPVKLVLSELKDKITTRDCEDLPSRSSQFLRYSDWPWEQVGSYDEVQLSSLHEPHLIGDFNLAWKMTFTSTLLHPVAQLLAFDTTFNRLLWDPCTTSVQILFEDNPYLVLLVKGGGWASDTGCSPFQYVCRTYAVAGENYDWIYEEHDNGDVFLFKLAASPEDFSITIVDVIFLVKSSNWEFKLNAKQYTDIISLTLTDLFVNAVVEFRNVLVAGVSISTSIRNQIRSRRPRTPRPRPRMPQKESSLEKLKKHARTADQVKIHGNVAASMTRRRSYRILPPPIVFQPSPRNSIDLEFSKIDFNRQFSISILPDEILMEIFALLSFADLCKCAQVCMNWKKISEDHTLWAFDPESIFRNSAKGDEWVLFYTSSKNIYSTNDSPDAAAVRDLVGDGASIKLLQHSSSPSPSPAHSSNSNRTSQGQQAPRIFVNSMPLNSFASIPFSTQPQSLTSPYSAAYNHVYNTYANQYGAYPHIFPTHHHTTPHQSPLFHPPPPSSTSSLPPFSHSFGHFSNNPAPNNTFPNPPSNTFPNHSAFPNNPSNTFPNNTSNTFPSSPSSNTFPNQSAFPNNSSNTFPNNSSNTFPSNSANTFPNNSSNPFPNTPSNSFSDNSNPFPNNPPPSNNFNTIDSNNIQYAFKKLKEFSNDSGDEGGEGGDKSDGGCAGEGAKPAVGGDVDVDVDTLNPNIYSISINDGPAETIHVAARRRYATAWPYKEITDDNESNVTSEANSGMNSANTSYTNFFELSVPSVHEFVRKSFRNFHPRRVTSDEERPKNIKRVTVGYAKALDHWVTGKFKRTHASSEGLQCAVTSLTVSDTDKKVYCGSQNGLLNVFDLDGTISRFRVLQHPITDISVDGMYMYIGMANGTCCQINNMSNKIAKEYSLYDDDHMDIKVGFGRSPSVIYTWDASTHNVDLHNWTSEAVVTFTQDTMATCVEVGSQRMAVGLDDGAIALWDIADPASALLHFRSHELEPTCSLMSPGERIVTSGSKDGCVMVWDERAGPYYVKRFKSKAYEIKSIETREYKLIVGMNNGTVAYWDPRYLFRPLHSWRLHEKGAPIVQVKLFPTETHLVCGAADGFVGMYDFS